MIVEIEVEGTAIDVLGEELRKRLKMIQEGGTLTALDQLAFMVLKAAQEQHGCVPACGRLDIL